LAVWVADWAKAARGTATDDDNKASKETETANAEKAAASSDAETAAKWRAAAAKAKDSAKDHTAKATAATQRANTARSALVTDSASAAAHAAASADAKAKSASAQHAKELDKQDAHANHEKEDKARQAAHAATEQGNKCDSDAATLKGKAQAQRDTAASELAARDAANAKLVTLNAQLVEAQAKFQVIDKAARDALAQQKELQKQANALQNTAQDQRDHAQALFEQASRDVDDHDAIKHVNQANDLVTAAQVSESKAADLLDQINKLSKYGKVQTESLNAITNLNIQIKAAQKDITTRQANADAAKVPHT